MVKVLGVAAFDQYGVQSEPKRGNDTSTPYMFQGSQNLGVLCRERERLPTLRLSLMFCRRVASIQY